MAGVKVKALNPENAVDTAIVSANCLYNSPVMPDMNAVGMNTESNTSTSPTTGPCMFNHGFLSRLSWRHLPFVDDSRTIFHHHNRIVDYNCNGQYEAEQRESVEGEPH